jgi:hypothetical protein
MGPIGGACCAADALFLPIENKLASKPATKACCCCECDLHEGVLIAGAGVVILGMVEALTFLFVVPNGAIVGIPMFIFLVVVSKGIWSVYNRELAGSASHTHTQRDREAQRETDTYTRDSATDTKAQLTPCELLPRSPVSHARLDGLHGVRPAGNHYDSALGRQHLHGRHGGPEGQRPRRLRAHVRQRNGVLPPSRLQQQQPT